MVQRVEHRADALVERAGAGLEGGHVLAGRAACRAGSAAAASRACRGPRSGAELAVGLEEADRHEERLRSTVAQRLESRSARRRPRDGCRPRHLVVADHARVLGDVLLADQDRVVAGLAQRVDQVLAVVVERPAAVGEAEHAVVVAVLAGEQRRPAARAGRRRAERLAEQDALVGEQLDVRGRHLVAVGLHVAAGVVRVDVEDVRRTSVALVQARLLSELSL